MKLSEMRQALTDRGIQLTKSLGQNFLHDGNQLRRIVAIAELGPDDQVLEIGPGMGPLTEMILERTPRVLAIEMDARLLAFLRERLGERDGLELRGGDALEILRDELRDWTGWKMVSNLPYSVASPILVTLTEGKWSRLVATLQLEVGKRVVARAGEEAYGLLSLLVQLRYEPAEFFRVPAGCFFPEPEVDSACVALVRRERPLLEEREEAAFRKIVKRGFSQRRKMMRKLLRGDWPENALASAYDELGLSPAIRAEAVRLDQFAALTRILVAAKEKLFN
jgi:16S rRNA (adenine1518-N6/adenine1519-N6)-dimethyltransferase